MSSVHFPARNFCPRQPHLLRFSRWALALCLLLSHARPPLAGADPLAPMLPKTYAAERNIAGWLVSEKLDGVRARWDGRQLWSKNGKRFNPPPAFVAGWPDFPLEGELWGGRGTYERTVAAVLQQQPHAAWMQLQFAIFDVPGEVLSFTARIAEAEQWFRRHPSPYAHVIPQRTVRDHAELQQELQRVLAHGGEGLIVRNPHALYAAGRSDEILKVKGFQDAEAVVIAHLPGQGRNQGRLGALLVATPEGIRFRIGSGFTDGERNNPPPVGSIITYKHHGHYPSGIPKFPSYLRLRRDDGL